MRFFPSNHSKEHVMASKAEFGEIQRKNMEAAMRLAQLSIENSQRILALQTQLARELFQDGVQQATVQAKSAAAPGDILKLRAEYAQATTQKMVAVAQEVAKIGNDARVEFSRLLTEQLAAGSQEMADAFQNFFKAMPGQNTNVMETMQAAMANANSAFEQMTRASAVAFENINEVARKTTGRAKK
jgi:phasin family protein